MRDKAFNILRNKGFVFLISVIQLSLGVYCFMTEKTEYAFVNVFIYWLILLLFSFYSRQTGILLFAFLSTFFVFLLGKDFFIVFLGYDPSFVYPFPQSCVSHMYFCMLLSLVGVFCGFSMLRKKGNSDLVVMSQEKKAALQHILLRIFYITLVFRVLDVAFNVYYFLFLGTRGHHAFYLLQKGAQINNLMFLGFLMLAPSKKELMPVLKIVLLIQVFTFLGGSRGDFLYFAVFVCCYLVFRDYVNKRLGNDTELFMTKRVKWLLVIIAPFFLAFLGLYAYWRLGVEAETTGVSGDVAAFFIQQGGSSSVIGYEKYYEQSFPSTNVSYTFGPLINFIKYGVFGKISGNMMPGLESAPMYANNMGATITWLVDPDYYYGGGGLGNQYIAELHKDFGYIGVLLFSVILGIVIRGFVFFSSRSWIINTLYMTGIPAIISMPRDFYLNWLIGIFSLLNIIVLILIDRRATRLTRGLYSPKIMI